MGRAGVHPAPVLEALASKRCRQTIGAIATMPSVGNTSSKGGGAVYEPSAMAVAPESFNSSTFQVEGRSRCVPQGTSVASIPRQSSRKERSRPARTAGLRRGLPAHRRPNRAGRSAARTRRWRCSPRCCRLSPRAGSSAWWPTRGQRWSRCSRVWRTGLPAAHGGPLGAGDERRLPDREVEHGRTGAGHHRG